MKSSTYFKQCLALLLLFSLNITTSAESDTVDYWITKIVDLAADELTELDPPYVLADISMGYSRTPPISAALKTSHVQSEVTVALYDTDGDDDAPGQPEHFTYFKELYTGYDDSWFGIALDTFDTEVAVNIDLTATTDADYTLSLLQKTASYSGVTVGVDFQLYLTAEAKAAMSFTTGLQLTMKHPAAIMMPALTDDDVLDFKNSHMIGFNDKNFELTPIFDASIPQIEFTAMLALRTVFSISFEGVDVGTLNLDLPAFDMTVETLQNMNKNCQPPAPGAAPDQIYAELIHLGASLDAKLSYELIGGEVSGDIGNWTLLPLLDECYAFLPGSGSLGDVPPSSEDKVLSEKPVTTCTTDGKTTIEAAVMSLNPGTKAGIAVGVVAGISIIAALAFFAGRASQRRSTKQHGMESIDDGSHSTMGGLLHRGELDDAKSNTLFHIVPVRQMDEGSSLLPISGKEVQESETRQIWPRRVPIPPVITVENADLSSSSESVSRQNDRPPADGHDEPGDASNEGNSGPARYWGPGDISGDGYYGVAHNGKVSRPMGRRVP